MKIVPPKGGHTQRAEPVLSLSSLPLAHTKSNSAGFELLSDPTDANSVKYRMTILRIQGGEDTRTLLQWWTDVHKVLEGLALGTPAAKCKIIATIIQGAPQALFEACVAENKTAAFQAAIDAAIVVDTAAGNNNAETAVRNNGVDHYITDDMVNLALQQVVTDMLPKKVLARVKRHFRRECRKPADMSIRDFYQKLMRINSLEIPYLPPFAANQAFGTDEIIDILLYAVPKSWHKEMDRQGFDPLLHSVPELVGFMEQVETAEDFDGQTVAKKKAASQPEKKKKDPSERWGNKFCTEHGWGGHTTKECKSLNGDNKRTKTSPSEKKQFTNKSWSRKAEESKERSKKELAAFIKKQVAQGVQKELASVEKKRKSSDDALDMNAMDLDTFNYTDGVADLDLSDEIDV